jgi:hypothetical protein
MQPATPVKAKPMSESTIYLSRRNLEILLSKLDRKAAGEQTECTIIKMQPEEGKPFRQSMPECRVVAVPDEEFYGGQGRDAGIMHPKDTLRASSKTNIHD